MNKQRLYLTRRTMVVGLGASGTAALLPSVAAAQAAATQARRTPQRIDVHHHFVPTEVVGSTHIVPPLKNWSVEHSLDDMDKGGVTTAMLSFTPQVLDALAQGGQVTPAHYRRANDFGAQLVADHKGRYRLLAGIPITDPDAALKEIDYAYATLKADGVGLFTSYGNQWLGNPAFDPVFAELNRRKAVVYTHPTVAPCCGNLIPQVNVSEIEYGTDTSRAIASFVFTGASQKFPDVRIIWSHGGGTVPFLIQRFTKDARIDARLAKVVPNGFMPELQRFYFDIAQIATRAPLLALKTVAPMPHILFGTDYPYLTAAEHVEGLKQARVFSARELRMIDENVVALVPALRA